MEKLYTISEVADKLQLASKTLRRWEETGKFVGSRTLGGQRRYSISDIQILDAIKHGVIDTSADLLTPQQAAALFGVSIATIVRWEDEGKIHPLITAGTTYYPRPRLIAKMNELKKDIPTPAPLSHFEPVDLAVSNAQPQVNQTYVPPTPKEPTPVHAPQVIEPIPQPRPIYQPLPLPTTQPQLQPLTYTLKIPRLPSGALSNLSINIVVTVLILMLYHTFVARQSSVSPVGSGSVQGVSDSTSQLTLLTSILDPSGNIKAPSLTTPRLSLSPVSPVTKPTAGNIYFDASSQTVKVYANGGWQTLNGSAQSSSNITGSSALAKGASSASVVNDKITANSHISVTFTGDYSPARSYWITKNQGSFTITTNAPVGNDVGFDYVITTPTTSGNQPSGTQLRDVTARQ